MKVIRLFFVLIFLISICLSISVFMFFNITKDTNNNLAFSLIRKYITKNHFSYDLDDKDEYKKIDYDNIKNSLQKDFSPQQN